MNMELITSAASDALVNVVLAIIALAGAYGVYYIRLGAAKLKEQTAQIKDEAGRKVLEDVLDAIRPSFQADGGDIELIGVDDETGVVTIEMTGACAACMFASTDISEGIDTIIKEHVPGVTAVRPVMY